MKQIDGKYVGISGIQHVGVGVSNHAESWKWYRKFFGMDIALFNAVAEAPLMDIYTRNVTLNKHAAMVLNLHGGYAMEIVQPISETPVMPEFEIQVGDLGIFIAHIKVSDVDEAFGYYRNEGANLLSGVVTRPDGLKTFYVKDPDGNIFQIVPGGEWFYPTGHFSGGTRGCSIGVSNIEKSLALYADVLGYGDVIYDETAVFEDWAGLPGGQHQCRRILLGKTEEIGGGFAQVAGKGFIELVQVLDRTPKKIYENRIWGDVGFVHLGFEVKGMAEVEKDLRAKGFPFTCDSSNGLSMGKTRVHCTYIEDPDGTLLELIEVFKIPIVEKWGIFMNVEKRDPLKPYPKFMLKSLRFSRIRD